MTTQSSEKKNISRHILPTASNLLGLCFVIFGMIKIYAFGEKTLLDEMTAFSMVLYLAACLFSYASIRAARKSEKYEKIADTLFLAGLVCMTLIAVVIAFELVR